MNDTKHNKCLFNPFTEGDMRETYPVINEIVAEEWRGDPYLDALIRYTILVYDPKSPLVLTERDLNYRKSIAAEQVNLIEMEEEQLQEVYTCSYSGLVEFTIKFLMRFIRSKEWAAIVAIEFKLWEEIKQTITPISGKSSKEELEAVQKKAVIAMEIDSDIKRLENYYRVFFGEDDSLEKQSKQKITPEAIANRKQHVRTY